MHSINKKASEKNSQRKATVCSSEHTENTTDQLSENKTLTPALTMCLEVITVTANIKLLIKSFTELVSTQAGSNFT